MKKKKGKYGLKQLAYALLFFSIIIIGVLIVSFYSTIWTIRESFSQILGILAGATLTSSITLFFICSESRKDKEVSTYNIKIGKYATFIEKMYSMLGSEEGFKPKELRKLRELMFRDIVFYLDSNDIDNIIAAINEWKENNGDAVKHLIKIVSILKGNLIEAPQNKTENIHKLWSCFECPSDETTEYPESGDFWHFCMLGQEQIEYFRKHQNDNQQELSLIEYGEEWRTGTLKKAKQGDIVFLFQRGGRGYIGVFKVIGIRVFDNREDTPQEYIDNSPQSLEQTQKDIQAYDIYKSMDDRATFCSNLIVTPLAFVPEGVGNPGGVYRKTISHYDETYAKRLLGRFLYMKKSQNEGLNIKCDEEQFGSLIKKVGINIADKKDNGNWEDNI